MCSVLCVLTTHISMYCSTQSLYMTARILVLQEGEGEYNNMIDAGCKVQLAAQCIMFMILGWLYRSLLSA
jgi:hypothetical protein